MKKHLFPFLICLLLTAKTSASDNSFDFSIEGLTGYTTGTINEILYHSGKLKDKKASLLQWKKNFVYGGLKINTEYKKLHLNTSFTTSLHKGSGCMEDSDWMNESAPEVKTTYSTGETTASHNYNTTLSLACDLINSSTLRLFPAAQLEYTYDSFTRNSSSKGWYGQLKGVYDDQRRLVDIIEVNNPVAWNSPQALKIPYERWDSVEQQWKHGHLENISYSQHQFFTWAGIGAAYKPVPAVVINISFMISPYCYFSAADKHNGKDYTSHLIQNSSFAACKYRGSVEWFLNKKSSLLINLESIQTKTIRGDNYNDWYKDNYQDSGIKINNASITAGFKYTI